MSHNRPRPTYIELIYAAYANPEHQGELASRVEASRKFVENGEVDRVFNEYPGMVCGEDMDAITHRYIDIMRHIKNIRRDHDFTFEGQEDTKARLDKLLTDIISLATAELLHRDGSIKPVLYTFLGYKTEEGEQLFGGKGDKLVYAYLGTTILNMQAESRFYKDLYPDAHNAFNQYLKQNRGRLMPLGMMHPNREIDLVDPVAERNRMLYFPKERPVETALMAGGVLAAAIAIGVGLFAACKGQSGGPNLGHVPNLRR